EKFGAPLHAFPAIPPGVCNLRPASRGWVRVKSADPAAHPEIRLNYLEKEEDRRVAVDAMRFTRRIMAAKALEKYLPEEYRPGRGAESDAELQQAAGELGTTIFHPSARARWAATRRRWSTTSCACTASRACAWSTRRSSRASPRETPTRRPTRSRRRAPGQS